MHDRNGNHKSVSHNGNNAACKVLLYWDYDTQWGGDRSRSRGGPKDYGHLDFENTERLLELNAKYDIPACFAVVGAAALPGDRPYHDPIQIRRIHAAGHEIGSHAFHHEWLPALSHRELLETLSRSKDALEQCIGAPVRSFVPPFNQPFDYPRGLSISLSERRAAPSERTDLRRLCEALKEAGYGFSRVSYRSLLARLGDRLTGKRRYGPGELEKISGITCVRLNTPSGFDDGALAVLDKGVLTGGIVVVCGHPHGLTARCSQNESYYARFLQKVSELRRQGLVRVTLPSDLLH